MLKRFVDLLSAPPSEDLPQPDRSRVAVCVLLVEAAHADNDFSDGERAHIRDLLTSRYGIGETEADELMREAESEHANKLDLFQYTNLINDHYSIEEKIKLVEEVWRLVLSDDNLDPHENHLMHTFRRLLRLAPNALLEAKERVLAERDA